MATPLASGPWNPSAQIGGAPAALLARAFERVATAEGLTVARVTYDFIRPAPIGPLEVRAEVVRPGRRVQLLEGSMLAGRCRGRASARAPESSPRTRRTRTPRRSRRHPAPNRAAPGSFPGYIGRGSRRTRSRSASSPAVSAARPATAWFRLTRPLVRDETPSALQRLAAASDFGAGLSGTLSEGRLPVHQPGPDAVHRARAGRGVDLPRVRDPDCARRHRGGGEHPLRRARPRRAGHPGAAGGPAAECRWQITRQ